MLPTNGVILTSAGSLLISKSVELVKPLEITHMKIGTGDINSLEQARALTDLVNSYKNINMSTLVRSGDLIRVRGSYTNEEFVNEINIKEVGVFAKVGNEAPVLFGYVNDGQGEIIPPGNTGNIISRTRDLYVGVTGKAEVLITINESLVYATIEDLNEGLNLKEDKFQKNSGFNKNKSDSTNLDDSNTLATSAAVSKAMKKATEASNTASASEPAFTKNSGFNLEKTNLTENDSNKIFTAKGALDLLNKITGKISTAISDCKNVLRNEMLTIKNNLTSLINGKENSFSKNGAFNKNFGTIPGTVLEGAKLAETLGLEYGGIVNNSSAKVAGKAYYCTANKAIYKCIQNTSLNYIDANYYEGLSNDKLLGKLQNLSNISPGGTHYVPTDIRIKDSNLVFYKFSLDPSLASPYYIRTKDIYGINLKNVCGIIPFSLATGKEYAHIGDGGAEPNIMDSEGFWVYHNVTRPCWFSSILIF